MAKLCKWMVKRYEMNDALGTRELLGEEEQEQPDGRVLTKVTQGEYYWLKYGDLNKMAEHFGLGLRELGAKPRMPVCIFADTRAEWLISAFGCFKNSIAICTIYTNLGAEGIMFGIDQTEVDTVITTLDLLPKLEPLLKKVRWISHRLVR